MMKFVRQGEIRDYYECSECGTFNNVPKGCDIPVCFSCEMKNKIKTAFQNYNVLDITEHKKSDRIFYIRAENTRRKDFKYDVFVVMFSQRKNDIQSIIKVINNMKPYSFSFHSGQPFQNMRYLGNAEYGKLVL